MRKQIEIDISCKCGKYWGIKNLNRLCKRCKTKVDIKGQVKDIK